MRRETSAVPSAATCGASPPSVSTTSADARAGRAALPAKITSSIPPPRIAEGRPSPITQRSASSRFDLPQPFGPTTPVSPSARTSSVGSTKDLKPVSRRRSKRIPECRAPRRWRSSAAPDAARGRAEAGFKLAPPRAGAHQRPSPRHPSKRKTPMPRKIPATIVTGFLGAGKTTLVRHLLQNAGGRRIALIVNEFGDLGVDGGILRGCGIEGCADEDVVELSNGCICCTVADDFVPTMEALLDRAAPPDHIVIETSGLALPQPLVRAFSWPTLRTRVTVDGVVTVIDGPAVAAGTFAADVAAVDRQRAADDGLDHETPLSELYADQVACADMIVVNKADLMEDVDALVARLRGEARAGVQVVPATMGALPVDVLLGRGQAAEDDVAARHEIHHDHDHHHDGDGDHHHDHGHDAFESFVVETGEVDDPDAFAARVSAAIRAHDVLRLKGFASVPGRAMRLTVQAVGPRVDQYFDRPLGSDPRGTRLVVIGRAGMDRAAIAAALA